MNAKIINITLAFGLISLVFSSCKENKKDILCQKWKTIALSNPKMEEEINYMKNYIDTLGNEDEALRKEMNLDSVKMLLRADFENSMKEQQLALENTLMEFKPNGVAFMTSIDGKDSAMYTIEDNFIKLDEAKLKGHGETMTFEIMKLTKDTLRIKLIDYGDTSLATMIPTKG
jgi:hypothetical protein